MMGNDHREGNLAFLPVIPLPDAKDAGLPPTSSTQQHQQLPVGTMFAAVVWLRTQVLACGGIM